MDKMPLYLVLLQSTPETAILISLGLVMIGVKPRLISVIMAALITSVACYLIRALPLPPGVNVLLQLPVLLSLMVLMCRLQLIPAAIASFIGIICLSLTELLFNSLVFAVTGVSVMEAIAHPIWRILYPLPEFTFLIVIIIMLHHYGISLFNLSDTDELELTSHDEKR